jgi:curved DNA-binding protein CbpA
MLDMLSNLFVAKIQHDKYIMDTTLYDELELPTNCTQDEIKQKYRTLAQVHHPDKGGSEDKFKRIKLAYEILSDIDKRAHYDSTGQHYEDAGIDNEIMTRFSNMVSHHTQHLNPEIDDLILKMKVDLYEAQRNTNNAINECDNSIRKFNIISKKIKLKKDEGENFLKSIVETKITQKQNELAGHKRTMIVFIKMLDILENYHYSMEDWQLFIK